MGIRKREHYLRKVASNSKKSSKGEINFSSLTNQKYINTFSAPEVDFPTIVGDIKRDVEEEIDNITRDLGINFGYSTVNDDQLLPTFDVCLSSKISNHDSMVLISSILPTAKDNIASVIVFTHDSDFVNSCNGNGVIDNLFQKHSLIKPNLKLISDIGGNTNLKIDHTEAQLSGFFQLMITNVLVKRNEPKFLGLTFTPTGANFPQDCACFKLVENFALPQNVYVTVIGKALDFIYTTKVKVSSFWHNQGPVAANFVSPAAPAEKLNISFKVVDKDADGNETAPSGDVMTALREPGNFVFIHPDS